MIHGKTVNYPFRRIRSKASCFAVDKVAKAPITGTAFNSLGIADLMNKLQNRLYYQLIENNIEDDDV